MPSEIKSQLTKNLIVIFSILLWIPVSYLVLSLYFPQSIDYIEHEKRELAQLVMKIFFGILMIGNLHSIYRCFKLPPKINYLVGFIFLLTLPIQFFWSIAVNMSVFGK